MAISQARARELLYAAHEAWNRRDIDALLDLYVDDLTYWLNFGGPDGGPITIKGKPALRTHVMSFAALDCLSVPDDFRFENGEGHANTEFFMRDPKTGLMHSASFRQVLTYRDDKILRLEEYHDASAFAAFIAMMSNEDSAR
jgi:ketosteroid isomerase-like protein